MNLLPSVIDIQKIVPELIAKYKGVIADVSNYEEILSDVRKQLGATISAAQKRDFEQWYFRARAAVSDETDPKQFGGPPKGAGVGEGRCHLPSNPVFYCGEHPGIALLEIDTEVGHTAYLAVWRSREHRPNYAMYGYAENISTPRMRTHAETRLELFRESLNGRSGEGIESLLELQRAMAKLFTSETWAMSAAMAHDSIYTKGFDGIEYPDAKTLSTYNFALNLDFAEKLELWRVWHCRMNKDYREIDFLRIGLPKNGVVSWRNIESENDLPRNTPEMNWSNILAHDWVPPEA